MGCEILAVVMAAILNAIYLTIILRSAKMCFVNKLTNLR